MKKLKTNLKLVLALGIVTVGMCLFNANTVNATNAEDEIVTFKDDVLKSYLVKSYDINQDGKLSKAEMKDVNSICLEDANVKDITGVEYATNLGYFGVLESSNISDISALSNLTNLTHIHLPNSKISDISALKNLTNLEDLNLESLSLNSNSVTDISALSNLTNLKRLRLNSNSVTDISALSKLTNLEELDLHFDNISDISALKNLTNLTALELWYGNISDISVLANFKNLQVLTLCFQKVSDISVLSNLTNLTRLRLTGCAKVSDISALSKLTNLEQLVLDNCNITDISALSNLTNLKRLDLSYNKIEDFSILSGKNFTYLDTSNQETETESSTIKIVQTDTGTYIRFEATDDVVPSNTSLEIQAMTEGTKYDSISSLLYNKVNLTKFLAYDITLTSNGVAIQPNGNVKISIPIPEGFDASKLMVYRITDDEEKIAYEVTVETIDGIQYATFETDHFSTYVLAEITEENEETKDTNEETSTTEENEETKDTNEETSTTNENEKDETPKTGMEEMNYILPITLSALGIVTFRKRQTK